MGDPASGEILMEVVILGRGPQSVRLGFNAPRSLEIYRREVWDRIRAEAIAAETPA